MNVRIVSEVDNMDFHFESPVEVTESSPFKAIIKGVLLSEGISRNNRLYTIDEMENIANQCQGLPIEVGVETRIDPNTGLLKRFMHRKSPSVGKILKAWLDRSVRKIFYIAEIFGSVARQVKKGWGVSIDGLARKCDYVLTETGKLVLRVRDMLMKKVQIIPPYVKTGVEGAGIESVEIQETMSFNEPLSPRTIAVIMALYEEGLV